MTLTDYMYQEKKEEEDLPALKTVLTHPYSDEDWIEKREEKLITTTRNNTDNTRTNKPTITRKKKVGEINSTDVLND